MKIAKCLVIALCCGLPLTACHKEAPPPCQNLPASADEQTLAVQRALADRHYDVGMMNGAMNSQTTAALQAFQKDTGLPQSGQADAKTLDALGFCPAPAPVETKPAPTCTEFPADRRGQIQAVQQALIEQKYDIRSADGGMGRKTRKALRQFQADKGLKKTGRIDAATREALGFCVEATDKPTGDKPAADKPTGNKPTGDKPASDKPTGNKAKGDESTSNESTDDGSAAVAAAPRPVADPQLQQVQRQLAARGYDPGPADGVMGKKTREALKRFQTDNDLLGPSGSIDAQTLAALHSSAAPTAATTGKTPLNPAKTTTAQASDFQEENPPAPASTTAATDNVNTPPPPPPAPDAAPAAAPADGSAAAQAPAAAAAEPAIPSSGSTR